MRVRSRPGATRVEMKVLLLGTAAAEPSFAAWRAALAREGVPHVAIVPAIDGLPILFSDDLLLARFQAVIFATAEVLDEGLDALELSALNELQRRFGVRRLIAYAYPGPRYGLESPSWAGHLDGACASLTQRGRALFTYLRGSLKIDVGTWGYLSSPLNGKRLDVLLAGPEGAALLGIHRHPDGREEMVQTFAGGAEQTHTQLLRHGQLAWVTRGTYLGFERDYLSLHIDDVCLANHSWSVASHSVDASRVIRMSAQDAARALQWSRARGLRLDLACNGAGSERFAREAGVAEDPLLRALLSERDAFGWLNHTYGHLNLDAASQETIEAEIERNESWARQVGIEFEPGVLVTGGHSGLADVLAEPPRGENPKVPPALEAQRVRFIACDASRPYPVRAQEPDGPHWPPGTPFHVGGALAIPRYPSILPFYAATAEQVLDRERSEGSGAAGSSWERLLAAEERRLFTLMMSNDPRPHYFHQSNLVGGPDRSPSAGGLLYALVDLVLERYRELFDVRASLAQPTFAEIGLLLERWAAWRSALGAGVLCGYTDGSRVTLTNNAKLAVAVPVTGTAAGAFYRGANSGWTPAAPGLTVLAIEPSVWR